MLQMTLDESIVFGWNFNQVKKINVDDLQIHQYLLILPLKRILHIWTSCGYLHFYGLDIESTITKFHWQWTRLMKVLHCHLQSIPHSLIKWSNLQKKLKGVLLLRLNFVLHPLAFQETYFLLSILLIQLLLHVSILIFGWLYIVWLCFTLKWIIKFAMVRIVLCNSGLRRHWPGIISLSLAIVWSQNNNYYAEFLNNVYILNSNYF